jgi:O-methyltransferase
MKTIVFGAGFYGRKYIEDCPPGEEIVAVCDNNRESMARGGVTSLYGHRIAAPDEIPGLEFDRVVIALNDRTSERQNSIIEIYRQILSLNIDSEQICVMPDNADNDIKVDYPRIEFIRNLSTDFHDRGLTGCVAECGVCWGDFACKINEFFPGQKLYLFDTFSGFDIRDVTEETDESLFHKDNRYVRYASSEVALLKCPNRKNVIVKKGYIPDTFDGLPEEEYAFVHLDLNLYAPTIASLRYFRTRMVPDGVTLVHDYYSHDGVKRAVDEFADECESVRVPTGDSLSVALIQR